MQGELTESSEHLSGRCAVTTHLETRKLRAKWPSNLPKVPSLEEGIPGLESKPAASRTGPLDDYFLLPLSSNIPKIFTPFHF